MTGFSLRASERASPLRWLLRLPCARFFRGFGLGCLLLRHLRDAFLQSLYGGAIVGYDLRGLAIILQLFKALLVRLDKRVEGGWRIPVLFFGLRLGVAGLFQLRMKLGPAGFQRP